MKGSFLSVLVALITFVGYAQPTSEELIQKYKGTEIVSIYQEDNSHYYKIKDKKSKKWDVIEVAQEFMSDTVVYYEDNWVTEEGFDEIFSIEGSDFFVVQKKGKYGIYHPISYYTIQMVGPITMEYPYKAMHIEEQMLVYPGDGKRWGFIGPNTGRLVREIIYETRDEIPMYGIEILEQEGGINLETEYYQNEQIYLIKNGETLKWGAYRKEMIEIFDENMNPMEREVISFLLPPVYDSIGSVDGATFFKVKNENKYGIAYPTYDYETSEVNCPFDELYVEREGDKFSLLARKKNKWGRVSDQNMEDISGFIFDNPEDVPKVLNGDYWAAPIIKNAIEKFGADLIEFDPQNGDGVFRARNKETHKWGMYQSIDVPSIIQMIPMEYDSVRFYPWNGEFTAVYNQGKVGFYLSQWVYQDKAKLSVPCIYEDYERFEYGNGIRLACKKNGKWGWVNWLTGKEESEFIYSSKEELERPSYDQPTWFEE